MRFGDVVLVELPRPSGPPGREQFGARPAIVVHADNARANLSTLVIVPLTSQAKALSFQGSYLVKPSKENGLAEESVVLSHQIRAIDTKRIFKGTGAHKRCRYADVAGRAEDNPWHVIEPHQPPVLNSQFATLPKGVIGSTSISAKVSSIAI